MFSGQWDQTDLYLKDQFMTANVYAVVSPQCTLRSHTPAVKHVVALITSSSQSQVKPIYLTGQIIRQAISSGTLTLLHSVAIWYLSIISQYNILVYLTGEPNNDDIEKCLEFNRWPSGEWNNLACDYRRPWICETSSESIRISHDSILDIVVCERSSPFLPLPFSFTPPPPSLSLLSIIS